MTEIELLALAAELRDRIRILAELTEHPRTNAAAIAHHRGEALELAETVRAGLLNIGAVIA